MRQQRSHRPFVTNPVAGRSSGRSGITPSRGLRLSWQRHAWTHARGLRAGGAGGPRRRRPLNEWNTSLELVRLLSLSQALFAQPRSGPLPHMRAEPSVTQPTRKAPRRDAGLAPKSSRRLSFWNVDSHRHITFPFPPPLHGGVSRTNGDWLAPPVGWQLHHQLVGGFAELDTPCPGPDGPTLARLLTLFSSLSVCSLYACKATAARYAVQPHYGTKTASRMPAVQEHLSYVGRPSRRIP
eukprot:359236-Chlamydomonas_euryale.AAC.9